MRFHERRILVTGATGGLGPSLVEAFLALGGNVIAVGRLKTRLDELQAAMAHHDRLDTAECDVSDPAGVEALFESIERIAPLDVVVHAAGAFAWSHLAEMTDSDIRRIVDGNLMASTFVMRAAMRRMGTRGNGSVVVVAADRALSPRLGFGVYGATKAAVCHLVEATALETGGSKVRVNAVLPGTIDTPHNRQQMPDADPACWASPKDIARAVLWLASDEARGIHGSLVRLPGA